MSVPKLLTTFIVLLLTVAADAQTDLTGRTYYNANIMADVMNSEMKDIDKKMAKARTEAIAKKEKEKGRKLTAAETAEIDKKQKEARAMAEGIKKGMSTKVTVEFTSATNAVMKVDMKVSDDALKAAGVSWFKRKAIKTAIAVAPSSQKATYVVNGNLIIMTEKGGKDKDTLRISQDGKYLYGKFSGKRESKLTRIK